VRLVALVVAITAVLAPAARAATCQRWTVTTIATDLGVLENLEPDGRGGLLLSDNPANRVDRLTPDGRATPLIADVPTPGGLRVHGDELYVNTGDSIPEGILQTTDGTIQRYDLRTGRRTTWSARLAMPNGLVFLPNADAVVSRDSPGWGLTRIPHDDPTHPQRNWVVTNDSNGLAVDPTGRWISTATGRSTSLRTGRRHWARSFASTARQSSDASSPAA